MEALGHSTSSLWAFSSLWFCCQLFSKSFSEHSVECLFWVCYDFGKWSGPSLISGAALKQVTFLFSLAKYLKFGSMRHWAKRGTFEVPDACFQPLWSLHEGCVSQNRWIKHDDRYWTQLMESLWQNGVFSVCGRVHKTEWMSNLVCLSCCLESRCRISVMITKSQGLEWWSLRLLCMWLWWWNRLDLISTSQWSYFQGGGGLVKYHK